MPHLRVLTILLLMVSIYIAASAQPYPPVSPFDLNRYLGTWYEIARMPNSFEKGLTNVTATYSLRADGNVRVFNRGIKNGKESTIEGKAKFAGSKDTAHILVSFFWIFYSDYIVVELDSAYCYALVAGANSKYLWMLARQPAIDKTNTDRLLTRAKSLGFETDRIYFTPHDTGSAPVRQQ
jgi:apolipoprotein D and lipocalin family protein